jgi:hypothetical protein
VEFPQETSELKLKGYYVEFPQETPKLKTEGF